MSDSHSALRENSHKDSAQPAKTLTPRIGRPSSFTQEIADEICSQLAQGISLRTVCKAEGMPDAATVFRWLRQNKAFCEQYTRAKEESADAFVEEMIDIADDGANDWMKRQLGGDGPVIEVPNHEHINRSRLRVDTRKWIAAKLKPKKYGDKLDVQHTHTLDQLLGAVPVIADPLAKPPIDSTATDITSNASLASPNQSGE